MTDALILYDDDYCHVANNDNGVVELIEGPLRLTLPSNKVLHGEKKRKKIILKESQYIIITNPYDTKSKSCIYGEKDIRKGPKIFSLYPGEYSENGVENAKILIKNEAAVVQSIFDNNDKKAGEKWLIEGPTLYFPSKYEKLLDTITAQNISQGEAIYIRNITNSELKLIKGPISYLRGVDEELYYKKNFLQENMKL